jgi:uncharacterized membrane protein YeaQ/YmgE (transglycosylase-associated protein family)
MLHLIWSVLVGFVVGLIARAFYPGVQHLGFFMTALLGIGGSLVGGVIGSLLQRPADGSLFHPAGFVLSIVGAVILLWLLAHFHVAL